MIFRTTMLDQIGIAALVFLLSALAWVPFTLAYCRYQDTTKLRQQAQLEAQERIHKDMEKACKTWFTDSRATAQGAIVACSRPEFMKEVP